MYSLIVDFWRNTTEVEVLSKDTLFPLIEVTFEESDQSLAKDVAGSMLSSSENESLDYLLDQVLLKWSSSTLLTEAITAYQQGSFDPSYLASKLQQISDSVHAEKENLDISPVSEGVALLEAEVASKVYPTGLSELDNQLRGGVWAGEIALLMAPSHRGKTQALCSFGAHALRQGIPVQHHTFEINRRRTYVRYLQNLLDKPRDWILKHQKKAVAAALRLDLPEWSIREYTGGSASTGDVLRAVQGYISSGVEAPLVIVDYLDLVKPLGGDKINRHDTNLTLVVEELRQIASDLEIGLWTASQVQRGAWGSTHIRMENVAESIGKVNTADVVVTMNQTMDEEHMRILRFYIDKARERGLTQPEVAAINDREHQRFRDLNEEAL
jgi:KaiC/GvpD/RAD55 family RecA-like ATPase